MVQRSTAWLEGYDAGYNEESEDVPTEYAEGSKEYEDWLEGYALGAEDFENEAEEEDEGPEAA